MVMQESRARFWLVPIFDVFGTAFNARNLALLGVASDEYQSRGLHPSDASMYDNDQRQPRHMDIYSTLVYRLFGGSCILKRRRL
jgi:hypothetical protein